MLTCNTNIFMFLFGFALILDFGENKKKYIIYYLADSSNVTTSSTGKQYEILVPFKHFKTLMILKLFVS